MDPSYAGRGHLVGTLFSLMATRERRAGTRAPSTWERLAVLRITVLPTIDLPPSFRRTMISTEISHLLSTLRLKVSSIGMRYLKRTSQGLVAVYDDPARALGAARLLRARKPSTGMRVRYALYWGDTHVAEDGVPLGGEAELLRAILNLTAADRASATGPIDLPDCDRVMVPSGTIAQFPDELRAQFVAIGAFRVAGYPGTFEIWTESLAAFLGREPTNTERTFGVAGLHTETVLDVRWAQRFQNLSRHTT